MEKESKNVIQFILKLVWGHKLKNQSKGLCSGSKEEGLPAVFRVKSSFWLFMVPPPPPEGRNPFLDPLLWPQACFSCRFRKYLFSSSESASFRVKNGFLTFAWARTPPGRGKTIFWTPCCGHRSVLTPMLLSQFRVDLYDLKSWISNLQDQNLALSKKRPKM